MKRSIFTAGRSAFLLLFFGITMGVHPQSGARNHLLRSTMLDESGSVRMDQIDYCDGLGRPVQSVLKESSPGRNDIITFQEYDVAGRKTNLYLPVPVSGSSGAYVSPDAVKTASAVFYGDSCAYDKSVYEPSPMEHLSARFGPGASWHNGEKAVKKRYVSNTGEGIYSCILYLCDFSSILVSLGAYPAGTLFVEETCDEDGNISCTFTDREGQTLLERVTAGTVFHDTYYVYDNLGQLRYVLPPLCNGTDTATLNALAYGYDYDVRGNCIKKKYPGCAPVEMKYDRSDRLVFSRDGNQKAKGEWHFVLIIESTPKNRRY